MTWQQLFSSSNDEEQLDTIFRMLKTIETRHNKLVIANCGIIHERRGAFRGAHFLNNKRRRLTPRTVYLSAFMFVLVTMSLAVWISLFHLPPVYAAPLMLAHLAALGLILTVKPYKRISLAPGI